MHADFGGHEVDTGGIILYGIPFITVDSNPVKGQQFPPGPTLWDEDDYGDEIDRNAGVQQPMKGTSITTFFRQWQMRNSIPLEIQDTTAVGEVHCTARYVGSSYAVTQSAQMALLLRS